VYGSFSVRPNNGTNTKATITNDCSAIEIPSARRLIFRSRAFCSGFPSIKQLLNVPISSAEFFFSFNGHHTPLPILPRAGKNFLPRRQKAGCLASAGAALAGM